MAGKSSKCTDTSSTSYESFCKNLTSEYFKISDGLKEYNKSLQFDLGENDNKEKESLLEKEIEEKKLILKRKRQQLADQLLSYKLMQFSSTPDVSRMYSVPTKQTPPDTEFKVPNPVGKQADSETSSTASSSTGTSMPKQIAQFYEECGMPYGLEETMLDMAIQASLADIPNTSSKATSSKDSSPGFSGRPETEFKNPSYPEAQQYPPSPPSSPGSNIPGSSKSITDANSLLKRNIYQLDAKNQSQHREDGESIVDINKEEDFMETDRYIGDKGKRPLSGKYAYKKRSKPSQADIDEQTSGSNLPKKDRSAE